MKLDAAGLALIKSREGCRLKAYLCPAKVWTIGYGHTGPEVHDGLVWTQEEADAVLQADLLRFDAFVSKTCPDASGEQHSAMVCLAFNIGNGAFAKSSVARLHNAGKYAEAAQAFLLWNKAGGKVLAGLVQRRAAESVLYLSGEPSQLDIPDEIPSTATGEKSLGASKTMIGQGIAGAATAATVLKETIPTTDGGVLQQIMDSLAPLAPYAPQLGTAIVVLGVVGIAISVYARWNDRREGRA